MMTPMFCFDEGAQELADADLVIRIPTGIQDLTQLFDACSVAFRLPSYFGRNWSALEDCLLDLSWLPEKKITIAHDDLPLSDDPENCATYLDVLKAVSSAWTVKPDESQTAEMPEGWTYRDHDVCIVFPERYREQVEAALGPV